jgi:hypothetical protein
MIQEATLPHYAAVACKVCREPIPVPKIVTQMDSLIGARDSDAGQQERVLHLRCRACSAEKLYQSSQIVEVEGEPRTKRRVAGIGLLARAASA